MYTKTLAEKIKNTLHIERSVKLVWKASPFWTIISFALTLIQGVIPLFALYIVKLLVDTVTETVVAGGDIDHALRRIILLVAAAGGIAILQVAVRLLSGYATELQAAVVSDYVSSRLHQKSIGLDLAYYENPAYYDTLHRAQQEGPYRPTRIVNGLIRILQNGVSLVAMIGLLFTLHWSIGLLMIISTLPGVIVQLVFVGRRYRWQQKRTEQERQAAYLSSVMTFNYFAKEIRIFELGQFFSDSFIAIRSMLRKEKLAISRSRSIGDLFAQIFAIVILFGCLFFIAFRALHGAITVGDMVMYYQALQRGISYLKEFLTSVAALYEDNIFVSYFFQFLDIENHLTDPPQPLAKPATFSKGIRFDNVTFRYPGQREPVLKNLSLTIGPNEVVALVGANGAGKSTIVKLLCRLYDPASGTVSLEGHPLPAYNLKELRSMISVVFQDFARYHMSVRDNIRIGDIAANPDDQAIHQAAVKANADEFIRSLPQGFDTMLGRSFHSGEELSLGEWQKIVLARAFLRNCPLIILDEPTSSLDTLTEYHLFTKFRELIAGNSALLISHRFSTVRMASRIYVIDEGQVAECGTHEALMEQGGIYADMYGKQASWLKDEKG